MNYPESFVDSGFPAASDDMGMWSEFDREFDPCSPFEQSQQPHPPPFKRARHSEETQSHHGLQCAPRMAAMSAPLNKGPNNIFFKTRICTKFREGACRNGENCNYAHGMEDLRQPPPNWQELVGGGGGGGGAGGGGGGGGGCGREEDRPSGGTWDDDQKIIHRMKLCKKFYNGEECPYGDRCNFLHEEPSKFRDDLGRFRESSAISIGTTTAPQVSYGSGSTQPEIGNRSMNTNSGSDALRLNVVKHGSWRTKLCVKYDTTGHCPFGDKCHFAHGQAELQLNNGNLDGDMGTTGSAMMRNGSVQAKAHSIPPASNGSPAIQGNLLTGNDEGRDKKCSFKWKGPKKINRIYADWLDDLPLLNNVASQVES